MRIKGVFNREGGTFRTMDIAAFAAKAEAIFARHGHDLTCEAVDGDEVESAMKAALAVPQVEALLAGGGDGTVSTAAAEAFTAGKPLGVLPAGTMNLFARSLGLPQSLDEALEAIASGGVAEVDIATANGEPFVHQYGVGIHARLVRIRDGLAYRGRTGKMIASLRAISAAAIDPPRFAVDVTTPRGTTRQVTSGLAISNNPFGEGHFPYADQLDRGTLGVYITAPLTTGDLLKLTIDIIRGHWRDNPMVWQSEVSELRLTFPHRKRRAQAVIDGELILLDHEVHIRLHPRGLKVLLPSQVER